MTSLSLYSSSRNVFLKALEIKIRYEPDPERIHSNRISKRKCSVFISAQWSLTFIQRWAKLPYAALYRVVRLTTRLNYNLRKSHRSYFNPWLSVSSEAEQSPIATFFASGTNSVDSSTSIPFELHVSLKLPGFGTHALSLSRIHASFRHEEFTEIDFVIFKKYHLV